MMTAEPVGDYLEILGGPLYNDPIRSIVTAGIWDGEPTVLLEFDIISAEIAALAWEVRRQADDRGRQPGHAPGG